VVEEETVQAVRGLRGCRVVSLGRTVNMVEIAFQRDGGPVYWLHASCQFRAVRAGRVLIGSYDMHWPAVRHTDSDVAFDTYTTMYDSQATKLTGVFRAGDFRVVDADVLDTGDLVIDLTDSVRFQAIPTTSGPVECWRLFERGGEHHVYPRDS
jgi:hypothetical protein